MDARGDPTFAALGEGFACGTLGELANELPAVAFVTVVGDPRCVTLRRAMTLGDEAVADVPDVATAAGTLGELGGVGPNCVRLAGKVYLENGEADGACVYDDLNEPGCGTRAMAGESDVSLPVSL
jgi:hypothetical protein